MSDHVNNLLFIALATLTQHISRNLSRAMSINREDTGTTACCRMPRTAGLHRRLSLLTSLSFPAS